MGKGDWRLYAIAERIIGYSRVGVELTKRLLWAALDAGSLQAHMDHEGHAQLFVRLTCRFYRGPLSCEHFVLINITGFTDDRVFLASFVALAFQVNGIARDEARGVGRFQAAGHVLAV